MLTFEAASTISEIADVAVTVTLFFIGIYGAKYLSKSTSEDFNKLSATCERSQELAKNALDQRDRLLELARRVTATKNPAEQDLEALKEAVNDISVESKGEDRGH